MRTRISLAVATLALGLTLPAAAHHTHAMYEPDALITLEGTVKSVQWINPHSWLYLIVTNEAGEIEEWALEARAPFRLAEQGWDLDAIQAGAEVSVTVKPLRRGARGGLFGHCGCPTGENSSTNFKQASLATFLAVHGAAVLQRRADALHGLRLHRSDAYHRHVPSPWIAEIARAEPNPAEHFLQR